MIPLPPPRSLLPANRRPSSWSQIFTDANVSCTLDDIRDLMFTDAADQSIDDLYQETSYGGIWLTGQVIAPHWTPV
jgi:hypothetical protein